MPKQRKTTTQHGKKAPSALGVTVPPESAMLIEYIRSIGVKRSSFNLLRSSESRLKMRPPAIFQFTK